MDIVFGDIDVDDFNDDNAAYCVSQRLCVISWAWEYYYGESGRSYIFVGICFSLLVLLSFLKGELQEVDTNKENKEEQVGIGGSNMR